jgi:hypothetical protein
MATKSGVCSKSWEHRDNAFEGTVVDPSSRPSAVTECRGLHAFTGVDLEGG